MKEKSLELAKESLRIEANDILSVLDYMDWEAFGKAVDTIAKADRIITTAAGSSGIAAKKFQHSLCCIEKPCQFMSPAEAVHGGLGCVQKGNVVIMVSRGGKTVELLPIINVVKKKGATLIGVTENINSPLGEASDIILPLKIGRESDKYNVMATTSYVVTVAIFDALLAAVMEETDYQVEQFALIHPGGAVGERLNK